MHITEKGIVVVLSFACPVELTSNSAFCLGDIVVQAFFAGLWLIKMIACLQECQIKEEDVNRPVVPHRIVDVAVGHIDEFKVVVPQDRERNRRSYRRSHSHSRASCRSYRRNRSHLDNSVNKTEQDVREDRVLANRLLNRTVKAIHVGSIQRVRCQDEMGRA